MTARKIFVAVLALAASVTVGMYAQGRGGAQGGAAQGGAAQGGGARKVAAGDVAAVDRQDHLHSAT